MSEKRKSELSPLVVEDYEDYVFDTTNPNKKVFVLPSNFLIYLNSNSKIYYSDCKTITQSKTTNNNYFVILPFTRLGYIEDVPNFSKFRLTDASNNSLITLSGADNYLNPKDKLQYILDYLITNLEDTQGFNIYWEKAKDDFIKPNAIQSGFSSQLGRDNMFYPNSLVIQRTNPTFGVGIKYSVDSGSTYKEIDFVLKTSYTNQGLTNGHYDYFSNVVATQDEIRVWINDEFRKPIAQEPLITRSEKYINFHVNPNFVVERAYLTFLRKPNIISYNLQIGSELPDNVINNIIQEISVYFSSKNDTNDYQLKLSEESRIMA